MQNIEIIMHIVEKVLVQIDSFFLTWRIRGSAFTFVQAFDFNGTPKDPLQIADIMVAINP